MKAVNREKAHWKETININYIESKIKNGILEGLNSKVQPAKKECEAVIIQIILSL